MSHWLKLEFCLRPRRALAFSRRVSSVGLRPFRLRAWIACFVVGIGTASWMASCVAAQGPMELARAAHASAIERLRSGEGRGYYCEFDNVQDTPALKCTFQLAFSGDKFRLEIEYIKLRPRNRDDTRKIIVCDGSAAFVTRYSDHIHPAGCETSVYKPEHDSLASILPYVVLNRFRFGLLSIDDVESFDSLRGPCDELDNGRLLFRRKEGKRQWRTEVAPEFGYLVSLTGGSTVSPDTSAFYRFTWRRTNGIWNVEETTVERNFGEGKTRREVLKYEEFMPNVEIPAKTFTMAALGMCENSRIIDRRPDAKTRIYHYSSENAKQVTEKQLDSMLEQLNALATQASRQPLEKAVAISKWRSVAGWFGGVSLLCLAYVAYRKWLSRG